jgi:hypothetical protein
MTHPLRTAIRVVSALTALQLLTSGQLAAQPVCRSATLMDYYALGAGGCSLGGIQLTDFDGIADIRPSLVDVTPTIDGDWIGFRMTGRLRAASPGGPSLESYQLAFRAQSALVSGIRTRVLGVTASGTGDFGAWGGSAASVQDFPPGIPSVLHAGLNDVEGAGRIPIAWGGCSPAIVRCTTSPGLVTFAPTALPLFYTFAKAASNAGPGSTALVTMEGHHAEFRVTVTPEPRAVVLLLMGVAMMGAILVRTGRVRL